MTTRVVLRRAAAAIIAGSLALQAVSLADAHSPDPPISWPLFAADDVLQFRWMEGEVPPLKMRDAVVAAASGAAASVASRAPTIAYASGGSRLSSTARTCSAASTASRARTAGVRRTASTSRSEPTATSSIGAASGGASSSRRSRTVATTSRTSPSMSSGTSSGWAITSTSATSPTTSMPSSRRSAGRDRRPAGMPTRSAAATPRSSSFATTWSTRPGSIRRASTWRRRCHWRPRTPRSGRRHRHVHRDAPGRGHRGLRATPCKLAVGAEGRAASAALQDPSSWTTVATMPASTLYSGTYQLSATAERHVRVARLLPEACRRRPPDGLVRAVRGNSVGLPDAAMPAGLGPRASKQEDVT